MNTAYTIVKYYFILLNDEVTKMKLHLLIIAIIITATILTGCVQVNSDNSDNTESTALNGFPPNDIVPLDSDFDKLYVGMKFSDALEIIGNPDYHIVLNLSHPFIFTSQSGTCYIVTVEASIENGYYKSIYENGIVRSFGIYDMNSITPVGSSNVTEETTAETSYVYQPPIVPSKPLETVAKEETR